MDALAKPALSMKPVRLFRLLKPALNWLTRGRWGNSINVEQAKRYQLTGWNKVHLCGLISVVYGFNKYLEITTTTTGGIYAEAAELGFDKRLRIVYRLKGQVGDGFHVDFTSETDDISTCLEEIRQRGLIFDIIFVDPHHTYECSFRDIAEAFKLLAPGGVMVIHDCRPLDGDIAMPDFIDGPWCGVTYKAYLDFVLLNPNLNYFTVDADFGCGIIRKPSSKLQSARYRRQALRNQHLAQKWFALGNDFSAVFQFFKEHENELLRLSNFADLRKKLKQNF